VKTDCHQTELRFQELGCREIRAAFDAGHVTSDAGALLLREVVLRTGLIARFAACFADKRDARYVEHGLEQLIAQRVLALAMGYEDVNDHDALRYDPLMAILTERADFAPLGGKSTINRMEQGGRVDRYQKITWNEDAIADLLVTHFLGCFREVPDCLVLDLDATDITVHGTQENRFFHGYYGDYCYLPLYITCGSHILCAKLRPSNIDAASGSVDELARIVAMIRKRLPQTRLIVRGDSGYAREELMNWCETNGVYYVLGLARNCRLEARITTELAQAQAEHEQSGLAARRFKEFVYRTRETWSRRRRVVGKAEYLDKGKNPRFIVTNLDATQWPARLLYETLY
jgi:hypothetical protein